MHSRIFGIYVLDDKEEVLKEFTPLNEDSFSVEDLNTFSDYVDTIDLEEEGRKEFETHLQNMYPNFSQEIYHNVIIYKIPIKDLFSILRKNWESYKQHSIQLQLEDFIDPFSTKKYHALVDLEGDKNGVRYAALMTNQYGEDVGYEYPETLLEELRYIYTNALKENKKEILIQLVGVLDYHN